MLVHAGELTGRGGPELSKPPLDALSLTAEKLSSPALATAVLPPFLPAIQTTG